MRLWVATELPIGADVAWGLVLKPAMLRHVTRGLLGFRGYLPAAWGEGETVTVRLLAFGVVPLNLHRLTLVRVDHAARRAETRESGGALTRWDHVLGVDELGPGRCRYSDALEIHAGPLTPLVWAYAWLFYRYRQARWRGVARVLAE